MSRAVDDFASREPYFAVLTAPRFLRANLTPAHEREFFASGEDLVSWMLDVIDAGLSPRFAPVSTLEYGCGIGRLAIPLARRPGSVTAVDASPVMLDLARREAERHGAGHIVFQTPAELFAAPRKFDLVICYHVLQRMRPREGRALLRQLIELISPNGVGVFQWPFRTGESSHVEASRWVRTRVPGANAIVNALRGRATGEPFIPTYVYKLDGMLAAFDLAGFRATHVVFEHQQNLGYAIVLAQRPERKKVAGSEGFPEAGPSGPADSPGLKPRPPSDEPSDAEIDAFNRAAETYYASLADWSHHLAKPFSQIEETPAVLMNAAVLLQGLQLTPGTSVLEFGAGTGWLSRYLTQLGCRVTLLDVSPTALAIARALFERSPVVGQQPAPSFLLFDGRRIDLPDGSVDRIICFDAFHHAPNPGAVIREFARVLAPGGIAGFAEPGPRHSESPRSQYESHTYGVVERDVDIHAIWRAAGAAGFRDLRMCVFHEPPYHVSLEEYEDLAAGGVSQERWLASTRGFLHHVRNFFLVKGGEAAADSRSARGLACEIRVDRSAVAAPAGEPIVIDATVTNTGAASWLAADAPHGGVMIGAHAYDAAGALAGFEIVRTPLTDPPRRLAPGEAVRCRLALPPLAAGRYRIEIDCVADRVTWFAQAGSKPGVVDVEIA
jgi:2-polyprenyl-3-methyl-5-hydroxy-6-metoxy-1,4-benzoquinol methylase